MKKIRKKITGYLKNITENKYEKINEKAICNKEKITYVKDAIKHTIIFKEEKIILIRESNEFKNILTFSKNRSILSEYIIKPQNYIIEIEVETLNLIYNKNELYIMYRIVDSNTTYEYKITMEE